MIVCKKYEARISALIDDELTIDERIEVLEHLDRCPACRAYWEDLLAMRDVLRAEEVSAPAGFADAVMARVRETKQEKAPERKILSFPRWKSFAALAACCAVVLLGIWSLDLAPGVNSMDMAALNGCAAPERATQGTPAEGSVWENSADNSTQEMPDVDYGVSDDAATAFYDAPNNPDAPPESGSTADAVKNFTQNGNFAAAMLTESDIAEQWVEENLNEDWVSGAVYPLTEEQYLKIRDLLESENEQFTEIMGENTASGYLLLAE